MTVLERFEAKFSRETNGCWEWRAARHALGYGQFRLDGSMKQAHRVAYELYAGPIPEGLELDHLCRNRACVNPAHLEPVTHRENVLRSDSEFARKFRSDTCVNGHELSGYNLIYRPEGGRRCRKCLNEAKARYKTRMKVGAAA